MLLIGKKDIKENLYKIKLLLLLELLWLVIGAILHIEIFC